MGARQQGEWLISPASRAPAHVWTMVASEVHAAGQTARSFLRLLTINKPIVCIARAVAGRLGLMVKCTVAQIPRAVQVFAFARELRVVADPGGTDTAALEAARAALERAGPRFRTFLSDDTESKMAWLPRLPDETTAESGYTVVCACSETTRRLGDVAEGLALAVGMTELVLEYLGEPDEFPNLAPLTHSARGLRVTIQQADFTKGPSGSASFASAAVTELAFKWCDLALLPPVTGFPNLKKLDVEECVFYDEGGAVLRTLGPVPTLEYVRLEGCEGLDDASPIAALPSLKTLVLCHFRVEYPDFDDAAGAALKAKLLSGAVNADGTGRMCRVVTRRLDICRAELEAARLARCDSECCGPCECGECSDCE
jgi:hypothetical protein